MTNFAKTTLAIFAAAFLASSPVIAAESTVPASAVSTSAVTDANPDLASGLKQKAADIVQQGQKKTDAAAQKLQDALGAKKQTPVAGTVESETGKGSASAQKGANGEIVDVQQEAVTVQTPAGTAQETAITVVPEG